VNDQVLATWRAAQLHGLSLRRLEPSDLDGVAKALQPGEGYTQTAALAETWQAIRTGLAGFGGDGVNEGFVVRERGDETPIAFLLYRRRNRGTDDFGEGAILGLLGDGVFPADGRFLQIHDLWVAPQARRRGIARALKRALEAAAASDGFGMIYTVTETTHQAVLTLNEQLGYLEVYRGPMWDDVARVGLAKTIG